MIESCIDHTSVLRLATAEHTGKTRTEMKTLNAESTPLLMVDGMCKAVGPDMVMGEVPLSKDRGGLEILWPQETSTTKSKPYLPAGSPKGYDFQG